MEKLDSILAGIHTSVVAAHQIASRQHLIEFRKHFMDGDKMKMLRMEIPDNGGMTVIEVPEIVVVPTKSVSMTKVSVKMKVFFEVDEAQDKNSKEGRGSRLIAKILGRNDEKRDDAVEITVEFEGNSPPEGYMKVREALDNALKISSKVKT